jgi:hypothetical protein
MPAIEVAPNAGKLLKLLVQLTGARRVLEIGTLAGFSTIWMGRGLPPDGTLVTCEFLPKHAEVAWANIDAAGLGEKVEIRLGPALETLAALEEEGRAPSTSSSLTRTRRTTAVTWTGPSGWGGPGPPWCLTMPSGKEPSLIPQWTPSTRRESSVHSSSWGSIRGWTLQSSRPSAQKAGTVSRLDVSVSDPYRESFLPHKLLSMLRTRIRPASSRTNS